jgi:hypothetical protein
LFAIHFGEDGAASSMYVLSNLWGGDLTCTNGPDRLLVYRS